MEEDEGERGFKGCEWRMTSGWRMTGMNEGMKKGNGGMSATESGEERFAPSKCRRRNRSVMTIAEIDELVLEVKNVDE